jgi:hypothetical protein
MPTFELSADGATYQIEAPDEQAALDAFRQAMPAASTKEDAGSSLSGTAKSLGVGLAQGAIGLAGMPGDLAHLWAKAARVSDAPEAGFGSQAIQKAIEGKTGEFYKPQGGIEQIASTIGQFAPAAIGGPGSVAARVATRAVAPALASEAAGALTGDNPYAKIGGALAGAAGASAAMRGFQGAGVARSASKALPTGDELVASGSRKFDQAHAMDVIVTPNWVENTAQDMRAALKGHNPNMAAPVFQVADRLESLAAPVAKGLPPSAVQMNEIEYLRQELSKMRVSPDSNVRGAASEALKALNKRQAALTNADAVSGDASLYSQTIRDAVGDYGAGKRSQIITGKRDLGELNAGTAGAGANDDNALRQALKQLARPINNTNVPVAKKLGFNEPEIDAIMKGATGTAVGNTARYVGKLAPTGSVSGVIGIGGGAAIGGPLGAVALPAVGYLAKKIGDLSTKNAIKSLDFLVRSRSPLAAQVAAQLPPQIVQQLPPASQRILQTLTVSAPALRQSAQPVPAGGY